MGSIWNKALNTWHEMNTAEAVLTGGWSPTIDYFQNKTDKANDAETATAAAAAATGIGADGLMNADAALSDPVTASANMTRAMSNDFFETAIPLKNDLIKMTTYNGNTGVVDALKTQGMANVDRAFSGATDAAARNTQRYGMTQTPEQAGAQQTALTTGKDLAQVDTLNRANLYQKDLNKQLVGGMAMPATTIQNLK